MSALLEIGGVSKTFTQHGHTVNAVKDVNLKVERGECLAVVGESGSGKTTLANMILGIYAPTTGYIMFDSQELGLPRSLVDKRRIQLVQQNPRSSLNPRRAVGSSIMLALNIHKIGSRAERRKRVGELLEEVGLPADFAKRSPASLSGGQLQRVAVARALACHSELVVLDEPTSALDVLVQAHLLRLLNQLKKERNLTYVFITHDLSVVRNVADRVAVFRSGELIETGTTEELFSNPKTDYTRALIGAVPIVTDAERALRDQLLKTGTSE